VAQEHGGMRPRPWTDVALGLLVAVFLPFQVYIKGSRPSLAELWWLVMPCHAYTAALAFCLLSRRRRWVNRVYTLAVVYFAWSPPMALAFPDFSDQIYGSCAPPPPPHRRRSESVWGGSSRRL
jgi:hypothetical protein